MAQYSYENYTQKQEQKQFDGPKIKFFDFLKNDGEVVLVRFPYQSVADIKIDTLHKVNINGNYRYVNCLRQDDNEPTGNCPLCAKGNSAKGRFIAKMIVYVQGANGIEIVPCVWNRPTGFARTVAERITDYGNSVFKIKRIGVAGDMKTTYDIMPAPANVYNEQAYPSDFSAFENFKPNNFAFLDRDFNELTQFVNTGVMPERQKAQPQQTNGSYAQQPQAQTYGQQQQYNQTYQQPQGQYQAPQQNYGGQQGYVNPTPNQNYVQQQQYSQPPVNFQQAEANPFINGEPAQQNNQPTQTETKPTRRYY